MNAARRKAEPNEEEASLPGLVALRSFEARTRSLSLESQMVECVDLLQHPGLVIGDLLQSVAEVREEKQPSADLRFRSNEEGDRSAFFYPSRELFVQGDGCSFTCLATDADFVLGEADVEADGEACGSAHRESTRENGASTKHPEAIRAIGPPEQPADEELAGPGATIDYAAVTCESRPFPVLGFTQRSESESAYPLLMRGLSSLIELLRPRRFDLMDREVYRGLLGPAPVFDVALVLWDDDAVPDERRPLCELTRDLAEVLKSALIDEPGFPPILNDIVCLRMNNKRFDGRLRFVWRV